MPRQAFGSRRVTRSLDEIAKYLDEGVKVAGGIKPGQTVRLDLEPSPPSLSPRLDTVKWESTGSPVITLDKAKGPQNLLVSGADLENTQVFQLVAEKGSTFFETKIITSDKAKPETGFTATITLKDPPPVSYHAFVVNDADQKSLLNDACSIKAPAETEPEPGLQLGAVVPNEAFPGDEELMSILHLLAGKSSDVSDVYVTDTYGVLREGWRIDILEIDAVKSSRALKQKYRAELVFLNITVPDDEPPGIYCLVAESALLNSEDKLAFYVLDPQYAKKS